MRTNELSIFKKTRLKFDELYQDSITYLKKVYNDAGEYFSNASPFGQLLRVTLNLGRLIFSYIEDSITELNIKTASRKQSIDGIALLTGHNPSRGLAARGSVKLTYNNSGEYDNYIITIPNYTIMTNTGNGLKYMIVLPSEYMKMRLSSNSSYTNIAIVQGELKYQQATGNGEKMQSYNFGTNHNNAGYIDNYFVNVYVNGERWKSVESILDMSFNEKACIIRTGQAGGLDVFFGTGTNGAIPPMGSTILIEYLVCQGADGNLAANDNILNNWSFSGNGRLDNGEEIDLNSVINISCDSDILFGTEGESTRMTRLLAPHASRSFVLANKTNYEYFLRKLNMFSVIDVIQGFNTYNDIMSERLYKDAVNKYADAKHDYDAQVAYTGKNSEAAKNKLDIVETLKIKMNAAEINYENSKLDDNTIYLFLVPNSSLRINDSDNYFTCDENAFTLTNDEKLGILNLIKTSGQQILTMDNVIIDPVKPRFAINCFIQIWENYDFDEIKAKIISSVSDYLLNNTRRDRIPVSDLISVVEAVDGVDSVTIMFDADKNNSKIYGENNYGIDEYGDIILSRTIKGAMNQNIELNDIMPLFRGNWTSYNGASYSDDLNSLNNGPINISLRGKSKK